MLCVVCSCLLFVVCCLLVDVEWSLLGGCCALLVACCSVCVVCWLLGDACCAVFVALRLLCVMFAYRLCCCSCMLFLVRYSLFAVGC